jgi:quinol monooxygenase YgiN
MELFLFAHLLARSDRAADVAQAILEVQEPTRRESGCLQYRAFRSLQNPNEFYIHSRWRDEEAFRRHVDLPHTVRFTQVLEPLLDQPLSVTLTQPLA